MNRFLSIAILSILASTSFAQVKIVAVSTRGGDGLASKEFVVLANHGSSPAVMTNWVLRRRSGASTTNNDLTFSGIIPAKGHFLIASASYTAVAGAVEGSTADYVDINASGLTGGLSDSATGVTVAIYDAGATTRQDSISYTGGSTAAPVLHEGTAFTGTLNGLGQTKMLYRKRDTDPGPYTDTDDNNNDLAIADKYGKTGAPLSTPPNSSNISVPVTLSNFMLY